jgi:SNF2 family DNA or RNA helicase
MAKGRQQALYYLLKTMDDSLSAGWQIELLKAKPDESGISDADTEYWTGLERIAVQRQAPPQFLAAEDLPLLQMIWSCQGHGGRPLQGAMGSEIIQAALATGRLVVRQQGRFVFVAAAERDLEGCIVWRRDLDNHIIPRIETDAGTDDILVLGDVWQLDQAQRTLSKVHFPYPAAVVAQILDIPPLNEKDAQVVQSVFAEQLPALPIPEAPPMQIIATEPVPVLNLMTVRVYGFLRFGEYNQQHMLADLAMPGFLYGDVEVKGAGYTAEENVMRKGEAVRLLRDVPRELALVKSLQDYGLKPVVVPHMVKVTSADMQVHALESESEWPAFMSDTIPQLKAAGWRIHMPRDFRHRKVEIDNWEMALQEEEDGWFTLSMGIVVDGQRLALAPLLDDLFKRDKRWLEGRSIDRIQDDLPVALHLPNGDAVYVPAHRLKPLARTLIDLFETPGASMRISRQDAWRLSELAELPDWTVSGARAVQQLARLLSGSERLTSVSQPEGFSLSLRPYQQEGVAWLQFLRSQQLGGILADDMGLGKTAQTLAHLCIEKAEGRLDRPVLIVLPTSLIYNWRQEMQRHAEGLRFLVLQGPGRKQLFSQIPQHDVILTTYPLLWRDIKTLSAYEYHYLILDEAQQVKNASSLAAQVIRKLNTRHRLCLTGTPVENHLGELWAQFDFLLPDFLGDERSFSRIWRTPIEKQGNVMRRDLLARRLKPFILRRRKEEVAADLPEKTIIIRKLELESGQRDLYETVRIAMDERVRNAIAEKGFSRSQIVILDALLKLRQVCCDPRLLKLDSARKVSESAKLELLMAMLKELIEEDRRMLVFSQFTSMLDLIAAELEKNAIPYVVLTGETQNRGEVIERFQSGEIPVFLISLKAGGTGLNLTAADTVIHYDPWWNPAVENQATDRAHRLGQTKPVFVYKLIVEGSIEEKMLALQGRKADLAATILSEDASALDKFDENDIRGLFEPLPDL